MLEFSTSVIPGWHTTIVPPYALIGMFLDLIMAVQLVVVCWILMFKHPPFLRKLFLALQWLIVGTGVVHLLFLSFEIANAWYNGIEYTSIAFYRTDLPRMMQTVVWFHVALRYVSPLAFLIKKLRTHYVFTFAWLLYHYLSGPVICWFIYAVS